jgi:hypothetical protein
VPPRPPGLDPVRALVRADAAALRGGASVDVLAGLDALPADARWQALTGRSPPGELGALQPARWLGRAWPEARALAEPAAAAAAAEADLRAAWLGVGSPLDGAPDVAEGFGADAWWRATAPVPPEVAGAWARDVAAWRAIAAPTPTDWALLTVSAWAWGQVVAALAAEALRDARWARVPGGPARRDGRLLVAAQGWGLPVLWRVLEAEPDLRDRVFAVVSAGGLGRGAGPRSAPFCAAAQGPWLEASWRHALLDAEVVALLPVVVLAWVDLAAPARPGVGGVDVAAQRLPAPLRLHREPDALELHDVGALSTSADGRAVGEALRLLGALLAVSRRLL